MDKNQYKELTIKTKKEFSKKLKELRIRNKLTQKQLANELSIQRNLICNLEQQRVRPNLKTLVKLADFFDVTADYLLGLED